MREGISNDDVNYPTARTQGKCPRCNHMLIRQEQSGSCPPRHHCFGCGYSDFDMKGYRDPGIFREAKSRTF